jgi:NAD(P)H-hydrate epimerase
MQLSERDWIMKLVTVSEMKAIEQQADAGGLTYDLMMENAGHHLAREVLGLAYSQDGEEEMQVLGLVGSGNNGGDTLVALTYLAEKGWKARAYLIRRKAGADPLVKRLEAAEGEVVLAEKDTDYTQLTTFLETADVVLDGVLGTGIKLPLKEEIRAVLTRTRDAISGMEWPPYVVAVDCPSGIDCDTGEAAAETIPADATVTMAAVKQGLLKLPAFDLAGEIRVVDIGELGGFPAWQSIKNEVADETMVDSLLPKRPTDAHKGTFGTVLVLAGSINFTGAALLAGKAAYRGGAGLVTLGVPAPLHAALAGHFPEATWLILPHELGVIAASAAEVVSQNLERITAALIGPGFGLEDTTREFLENLLVGSRTAKKPGGKIGFVRSTEAVETSVPAGLPPVVIDADGLKLLSKLENWTKMLPAESILTPHPGEMSVLTGLSVEAIQADRLATARRFAEAWGHVVVLKGAFTVIAAPDGKTMTIPVASAALARAGSGDVLAGLIVGLRAQGLGAYPAAVTGAWIHAQAGLLAGDTLGNPASVLAGDILESIPEVISGLVQDAFPD